MDYLVEPSSVRLGAVAWFYLAVLVFAFPLAALQQHRRMAGGGPPPTRGEIYASAFVTHAALVLLAGLVMRTGEMALLKPYQPDALHVLIGAVALAAGLLPLLERFRATDLVARERMRLIAPRTAREHAIFYAVSASAGIAEELAYRGVLFTLLAALVGHWWPAALLSAAAFGAVHLFQGGKSAGVAVLIGLREQIVVGLTGTLMVAIVVHAIHNAIVGTVVSRRARREERALAVS